MQSTIMLFGVTTLDVSTFGIVAPLFTAGAMTGAYLPARRATVVDPIVALRQD